MRKVECLFWCQSWCQIHRKNTSTSRTSKTSSHREVPDFGGTLAFLGVLVRSGVELLITGSRVRVPDGSLIFSRKYRDFLSIVTMERKITRYIDTLLSLNSTRILNDFDQIILESGQRLEAEIREMLNELRSAAENALSRAEETRAAGTAAVASRLQVLEELRQRLVAILEQSRALLARIRLQVSVRC
jgi:hypothetical protein